MRSLISYPDRLSSEKISGKIGHVLRHDCSMKMARCKSRQPDSRDFLKYALRARRRKPYN